MRTGRFITISEGTRFVYWEEPSYHGSLRDSKMSGSLTFALFKKFPNSQIYFVSESMYPVTDAILEEIQDSIGAPRIFDLTETFEEVPDGDDEEERGF